MLVIKPGSTSCKKYTLSGILLLWPLLDFCSCTAHDQKEHIPYLLVCSLLSCLYLSAYNRVPVSRLNRKERGLTLYLHITQSDLDKLRNCYAIYEHFCLLFCRVTTEIMVLCSLYFSLTISSIQASAESAFSSFS